MHIKILAAAAFAIAALSGTASADTFGKTQAGAGLFDQGGLYYPDSNAVNDAIRIDPNTVSSTQRTTIIDQSHERPRTGVPSDTRNEPGLGLFDVVPL